MNKTITQIKLDAADENFLSEIYGINVEFSIKSGKNSTEIAKLLETGKENSINYLKRNKLGHKLSLFDENNLFKAVAELQTQLGLDKVPRRIECYDISHFQGNFVYGSMVTCIDGRMEKKFYKLFKCHNGNDDFANHKEVLSRRLSKWVEKVKIPKENGQMPEIGWALPDLIIVDGGKGQLSGNFEVLKSFDIENKVAIIGLAKQEEEVFFPQPLHEQKTSTLTVKRGKEGGFITEGISFFLLQRIRDEAHRFAITNNRNAMIKGASKSSLQNINGIGEVTKTKILKNFGSIKNLVQNLVSSKEYCLEVLGQKTTDLLLAHFKLK